MSDDSKACEICAALRDELGDRTFEYVLADARLQSATGGDADLGLQLKRELEKTRGQYEEAREDLIRHYQERHPVG